MPIKRATLLFLALLLTISACSPRKDRDDRPNIVIIGVPADADSFNPLFATSVTAGQINDLIYPSLIHSSFDFSEGIIEYHPSLAQEWEFKNDNRDIVFHLRTDAAWEDGVTITARDVKFSYELYGNPDVGSIRQAVLEGLRRAPDGRPDVTGSIQILNDSTIVFQYEEPYPGQIFDAGLSILPAHIFEEIPLQELRTHPINRNPVGAGPFTLASWVPQQEITLKSNPKSVLPHPAKLSSLIFRIIPDYRSRLAQLESGEIDIIDNISVEDAERIDRARAPVNVVSVPSRRYFYVGWNNINPEIYSRSNGREIRPHPIFGNQNVRRALTMAINRDEITQAFFGEHAVEALSPIPPMFRWAYNDELQSIPYDPQGALRILDEEGWRDIDGTGTLRKGNLDFSFTLHIPVGDQLRVAIASIIQEQLRRVKIDVKVEQVELAVFSQNLMQKRYDAWIVGFTSPLELQLDEFWGFNLAASPFNLVSFRNKRIDEILSATRQMRDAAKAAPLWKEFQEIFHKEQPATFLFWVNNLVGINERVKEKRIDIHGITHNAWQWYTDKPDD